MVTAWLRPAAARWTASVTQNWGHTRKDLAALAVLTSLTLLAYGSVVGGEAAASLGEGSVFVGHPLAAAKRLFLDHAVLPLWDPWSGSGDPLVANPLATSWYPPAYLAFLSAEPALEGMRWLAFAHLLTGVWATYALARMLGLRPLAATYAPLGYLLSLHMHWVVSVGLAHPLFARPWMPLGIGFLWFALTRGRMRYAVLAAITLAAQIYGATVYMLHFTLLAFASVVVGYAAGGSWQRDAVLERCRRAIQATLVIGVAGAALAAPRLIPIAFYTPISTRGHIPLASIESSLSEIPSLSYVIQTIADQGRSPFLEWWGVAVVVLAAIGLVTAPRPVAIGFGAMVLIGVWAALGPRAPVDLYAIFYNILPNFRFNTTLHRMLELAYFAIPILTAFGLFALGRAAYRILGRDHLASGAAIAGVVAFSALSAVVGTRTAMADAANKPYPTPQVGPALVLTEPSHVAALPRGWDITLRFVAVAEGVREVPESVRLVLLGDRRELKAAAVDFAAARDAGRVAVTFRPTREVHSVQLSVRLTHPTTGVPIGSDLDLGWLGEHGEWTPAPLLTSPREGEPLSLAGQGPGNIGGAVAALQARDGFGVTRTAVGRLLHDSHAVHPVRAVSGNYEVTSFANHGFQLLYALNLTDPLSQTDIVSRLRRLGAMNARYLAMSTADDASLRLGYRELWRGETGVVLANPYAKPRAYAAAHAVLVIDSSDSSDLAGPETQVLFRLDGFDPALVTALRRDGNCFDGITPGEVAPYAAIVVSAGCAESAAQLPETMSDAEGRALPVVRLDDHTRLSELVSGLARTPGQPPTVTLADFGPLGATVHAGPSSAPRVVNLATMFFPGWKARHGEQWLDGRIANGLMVGVVLPPGDATTVEFRFESGEFTAGVAVAVSAIVVLIATPLAIRLRRHSASRPPGGGLGARILGS